MSLVRRALPVFVAVLVLSTGASAQRSLPDLPDYPLRLGPSDLWGIDPSAASPDDPAPPTGHWTITPEPLQDGVLDLHVRVEAPPVSLPVEAGPAILFTTVALRGSRGGFGLGRLVSVEPTFLSACTGAPCVFEAAVSADLQRLPRIAGRIRGLREAWAEVGFRLVRTFGGRTWLQVLGAGDGDYSGTLGHPVPLSFEPTDTVGLLPAESAMAWREDRRPTDVLDALHDDHLLALDESMPPTTTDVRLVATYVGCGEHLGVWTRTAAGDLIGIPRVEGRDFIDATVALPRGSTWRLGWESDSHEDGVSFPAPSAATFEADHRPLLVAVATRCGEEPGSTTTEAVVAEVIVPEPS